MTIFIILNFYHINILSIRFFFVPVSCLNINLFNFTGVGFFTRKIGNNISPTVTLEKNGNKYKLLTESTFKTSIIEFELGKEFDETTLDDRQVKSVITLDGNTLIHKQGGAKPSTITRVFGDTEMVATMTVGHIVCTRKYKAV